MSLAPLDLISAHPWERVTFTTYALSLSFFEAEAQRGREETERAEWRREQEALLQNPDVPAEEKELIRAILR